MLHAFVSSHPPAWRFLRTDRPCDTQQGQGALGERAEPSTGTIHIQRGLELGKTNREHVLIGNLEDRILNLESIMFQVLCFNSFVGCKKEDLDRKQPWSQIQVDALHRQF